MSVTYRGRRGTSRYTVDIATTIKDQYRGHAAGPFDLCRPLEGAPGPGRAEGAGIENIWKRAGHPGGRRDARRNTPMPRS